ncbi:catalase [Chitinasiproducens palmae]|uniref:Catalase n=1 Tax=Chitinasiproducens palmae TaxID=1770053 RepID=A0A1H2PKA3_9BURK|nr:catalase [Chitinasiproducens palmae]SDV46883.1 catalase [Chitinasiproducens palmae]
MPKSKPENARPASRKPAAAKAASRNTESAPSHPASDAGGDALAKKMTDTQSLSAGRPYNALSLKDHGHDSAVNPEAGETVSPDSPDVTGSTLSEHNPSEKTGAGQPPLGRNATIGPLDRVRADASGQPLTTNQGVHIADNQNTLKAGLRGPALLEDFILREKITHFDHERIPERIVHARGSGAHGYFENYAPLTELTRAAPFQEAGKITPVFVRFSTVAGERGSIDTARDVRGFAVKFYTDEGNWDLVGNNIPVFFIQDAMKFPDLVHAVKPEPHHGMPQAASAHDTFWDFASLSPEITHMLMWVMSDRAIPRSYRMMQGFGVHTFRLVNAEGVSHFVKFHWKPRLGTHSLVWDEAVKIAGADPDFHRRDLWEAIEAGEYPEWELGFQIFTEEQADQFSFDILDATKIIPEEVVPVTPIGRMVLNRNPDNFFAETEQVAFCTAHIVPGLDFSHDPLLAGRIHSYVDTQISRLGGPNFHELPINSPIAPVNNNQRDGMHRQAIHRGRVAYEPNSLGGGCPFQTGKMTGFVSFPAPVQEDKVRGKPEKFADHYTQAALFYNSQTENEKAHIVGGFRFELSRVTVPAIRQRMVAGLRNASEELAQRVAEGLGMELPEPLPRALPNPAAPEVEQSPALSLTALPGEGGIRTRKIALLVANGVAGAPLATLQTALVGQGAVPRLVGVRLGTVKTADGDAVEADASMENTPAVLFDALVLPDGQAGVHALLADGHTLEFLKDQYRHCKTILALGASSQLFDKLGISQTLPDGQNDPGLLVADSLDDDVVAAFVAAVAQHRHAVRDSDPPLI